MCYNAGASIAAGAVSTIVSLILILTPYITLEWPILKYFKQSKEDNRVLACVLLGVSTLIKATTNKYQQTSTKK